jgi:putative membrane protein
MSKIFVNWLLATAAIAVAAWLLPGVSISGVLPALIAAVVLGAINAFIRPILFVLTLPINILTLGLFTLVLNALLVMLASALVPGFSVAGFIWAFLFSLVLGLANWIFHRWSK